MADENNRLPEGTDKIIAGASGSSGADGGLGGATSGAGSSDIGGASAGAGSESDILVVEESTVVLVPDAPTGTNPNRAGTAADGSLKDKIRSGGGKLSGQAADKARGLVSQGLGRSAEALANVARLVGETADGLEDRLGAEYGDYARRAAGAIEGAANNLADKDPDELIDDTRDFVRRSPGVALAGAAIVGFALARLVKSGLTRGEDEQDSRSTRDRSEG